MAIVCPRRSLRAIARRMVLALLGLVGFGAPAVAQYHFDAWTADDGLPQNIIRGLHQTSDGYLWIATLDGLARFDGVRFTVFNRSNSPGIESNRFTALHAVGQGEMWLGTEVGTVTRHTGGRFVSYTTAHGLERSRVQGFTSDASGHLWVLSGATIKRWEPERERFVDVDGPETAFGYRRLSWGERGGFWGLDRSGLRRFVGGQWESHPLPAPFLTETVFAAEEQDGSIWVSIPTGPRQDVERVGRITRDGRFEALGNVSHSDSSSTRRRPIVWRDRAGTSWTFDLAPTEELVLSLTLVSPARRETVKFVLQYEDREGNLWLGTEGDGLYRVRRQVVTVRSLSQGLVGRNVYPVFEDRDGAVWVGTWQPGGLSRFENGTITSYTSRHGLTTGGVTALQQDQQGRLWVATHHGLQVFDNGRFTAVAPDLVRDGTTVNVIHHDPQNATWLGTDRGLLRLVDGRVTRLTTRDGLATDDVRVIIDDQITGGLWIGGYGGVTRWRDGRFHAWMSGDGPPGPMVRALYQDGDGVLWIGTYDSGLVRLDDGRLTHYTTRVGLFNDGVFQILDDGRGWLWMSSNRGIYRVSRQELDDFAEGRRQEITSIAYGKSDGMLNVECNGGLWPAGIKARDGSLWFPTQDGVAVIDPAAVAANPNPPPVVIESFLIDRQPVDPLPFEGELRIGPRVGALEIRYTGLSFLNAEHLRFKYRLEGLDEEWIEAGTRRTAYYSHVPPGRYTFSVIAANSDGVWNTRGASLAVVVLPPFYRSWWFTTLALGAVVAVVGLTFRAREARLKQAHAAQQAFSRQLIASQEAERKRIAAELHDSLGQRLVIIRNLALLLDRGPAGANRPSTGEIAAEAAQAIGEVREIAQNLRPCHLDRLGLTRALEALVRRAAGASTTRITAAIDDLEGLFPNDGEICIYRVVQESVNNILKHSAATHAWVTARRSATAVLITVSDNGCGFAAGAGAAWRDGFGLAGMSERVMLLGGRIEIASAPGSGTTIRVAFHVAPPARPPAPERWAVAAGSGVRCHVQ
jgi:signal transduction histidine kinase/ligand-binding sensor domain-containing protein